ncbi:polyphosphate kinase 1 [Solirubrobacter ginsenosidimutans]|uniref:Polyphosphate kinase n=1 Tax=Solirubrobacter ginsenosidimutans TaxID=490573 RepID=A0A9X3S5A8_9ACTN|nr:polyphosphate kinase 1 [Solirubrobacter ginsenosidimutans]MDA0161443.1 polyphosphate kinase 1 [Solirubrobacter ginsenosidimutans]
MSETTSATETVAAPDLQDPSLYYNRELSWMQFNERVLELAEDASVPLLERVKFCAIYSSNLDEFFMVRVAGLHDQIEAGIEKPLQDGRTPSETIEEIRRMVREHAARQSHCLDHDLRPALAEHGIRIVRYAEVNRTDRKSLDERFRRQIFPVLTPLAVGLGRPFPYISNLSLSLGVIVRDPVTDVRTFARVKVPKEMLPRFVPVGDGKTFVPLEDVIAENLDSLFPGMEILDRHVFRVTRDADFSVSDDADDLLQAVEEELRARRFGEAVRVEVGDGMSEAMLDQISRALEVGEADVFQVSGLLDLNDLFDIVKISGHAELRDTPYQPVTQPRLQPDEDEQPDVLAAMRKRDILLHHPYDSFVSSVERFVEQAVNDPDVLAIKQTVYRTSDDSPLVPALIRAAERGKQAVCLVEVKARFDERANIQWGRALEEAGVHVVYGLPSLKTHAKCILVVRREGDGIRHYLHVGTGNYNAKTARLYTDFGLLTCDDELGADVADMFNFLTGFARPGGYRRVLVAPAHLRNGVIEEIERTIAVHKDGKPAKIRMKMNSLVDRECIQALYRASQAGVKVEINTRGICCLKPGVPGVSENIRVVSIVGRFLEHSRIYAFEREGDPTIYIGSADLMPRNLDTRVELLTPIRDESLRGDLVDTLDRCFADNVNAWELDNKGNYTRRTSNNGEPRSVQRELMTAHAAAAAEASAAKKS